MEREYVVLEEWRGYVEVTVTAPNKRVAIERAKEGLRDGTMQAEVLHAGNPTGRYEARRG